VRIEIEDNGRGIPEAAQPHIFSPRFTTKSGRVEFGLGLGLPISKSIIERHGGSIRFDSRPGRTVFTVELPTEPPAAESKNP
jgi:signal transduction histidine kinase